MDLRIRQACVLAAGCAGAAAFALWTAGGLPAARAAGPADATAAKSTSHWAYMRPARPTLPQVKDKNWCRNGLDYFVLAKLEKEGLHPSREADRATLLRRVTLALVGVPPTIKEVDDFVADQSPDAYEKVVDRLLANPHFGERAAMRWLDLARYADSNGYERDHLRSMWPYRDWVINALNADMPFDQFTVEQLAGDLLPSATTEQKIATGFNRNTMLNREAGSDQKEFYYYAVVDRVNTTATVWLGTTLNCAQCHNHKYDPFTQKDYYRLFAYFNNTAEEARQVGGSEVEDISPRVTVNPPAVVAMEGQIAELNAKLNGQTPELDVAQAKWEQQQQAWMPLEIIEVKSVGGATLSVQPDQSILASGASPATDTYTLTATTSLPRITAIRLEALPDDSLPGKGPGRAENGNFGLTHLALSVGVAEADSAANPIALKNATADFSQDGWPVSAAVGDKPNPNAGWAINPRTGQPHAAVFNTTGDVAIGDGTVLTFTLEHNATFPRHVLGHFRILATSAAKPPKASDAALPPKVQTALDVAPSQRDEAQRTELTAYYRSIAPELQPTRDQIRTLQQKIERYSKTTLVMQELPEPRESHLHVRGGFLTPGEKVEPMIPALFRAGQPAVEGQSAKQPNRLDLARWLVNPENPLSARVTVNRIWEQYFGKGIVATSEDFGTQGERPSNQQLLDWLAMEFMQPSAGGARPWSMKALARLIVTSATFRQCSDVSRELAGKDPANRLLARGPRFRLPAEMIRDQALAAGGLLSEKIGGPSVFPLQPGGIWRTPYSGEQWNVSEGEDRYRRGIYTFLRRSSPYPAFTAFDMTTRETICTRRSSTDTPLQALTTLNDPAFVQPAAALARRVLKEGDDSPASRATFAFRTVLARSPDANETQRLVALYGQMLEKYQSDPKSAQTLATSGLPPASKDLPPAELAAWTMVCNVLLNLDETLTTE
ncbi:MAG TPA: DUF1549 and DUF1553 domain-containing protein [Tepidisphaeraceae bacterium]|jgi:hypothetical protein|nr:DUF1549 and DUF1553 domain-containing protein [Tepidisphaeraceae bacterium]